LVGLFDKVGSNPTFEAVLAAYRELKGVDYDVIVSVGGGSVLDTAKVVTAIDASGSEKWINDHLKGGTPFPELFSPKPVIAIPTTAGTGSEVTMWATVWDMKKNRKYSLNHPKLYPKMAFLDPELTLSLPQEVTIYTGLDALSHAMESVWNKNHNPVSDVLALRAMGLIRKHLPKVIKDSNNINLRTLLLRASLLAGLAFSNTQTTLAHSISYPLTAYFGLPHGLACALPLPHLMEFNGGKNFERVKIMAGPLASDVSVESMKKSVILLFKKLGVSTQLEDYGISENDVKKICEAAITPERSDNNIAKINQRDIITLVKKMF